MVFKNQLLKALRYGVKNYIGDVVAQWFTPLSLTATKKLWDLQKWNPKRNTTLDGGSLG